MKFDPGVSTKTFIFCMAAISILLIIAKFTGILG